MNEKGIPVIDPLDCKRIRFKGNRIPGILKVRKRIYFGRSDKKRIRPGNRIEQIGVIFLQS